MATGDETRLIAWHRELVGAHDRLREALRIAQQSTYEQTPARRDLLLFCHGFCVALGGHHTSEDEALFPELVARHPELSETIARLAQDHDLIAVLIQRLDAAICSGATVEDVAGRLDGIAAIMESHFRYEERRLVEVLASLRLRAPIATMLGPL